MLAYASAALCAIAAVFTFLNIRAGSVTSAVLVALALMCLSLHLAGVGVRPRRSGAVSRGRRRQEGRTSSATG